MQGLSRVFRTHRALFALSRFLCFALPFVVLLLAAGCAVGPDFHSPAAPGVDRYTSEPLPARTASASVKGGEAQAFVPTDIPGEWWTLFHSKALDELIEQALKANPDLEAAQAALRGAWENVYAQRGAYLPGVEVNFNPTRQKIADSLTSPLASNSSLYSLHTAQVSVGYTIDAFGGMRRQVESLKASADFQRFQLEAAYLTLTSNVVTGAIEEAALRGQIAAAKRIIEVQSQSLDLLRRQYGLGQIAEAEVVAQEAALAQTQATLPPLEKQLAQQRDLLARLAGRFPSETLAEKFDLSSLDLPVESALDPSLEACGATAGCARSRRAVARGERRNRRRHCQPAAQYHPLCRFGIGCHRSGTTLYLRHRVLGPCGQRDAACLSGGDPSLPAACGPGRL